MAILAEFPLVCVILTGYGGCFLQGLNLNTMSFHRRISQAGALSMEQCRERTRTIHDACPLPNASDGFFDEQAVHRPGSVRVFENKSITDFARVLKDCWRHGVNFSFFSFNEPGWCARDILLLAVPDDISANE